MKTLYLTSANYNQYQIIAQLKKEVLKRGGQLVCNFPYINTYEKTTIFNRSIMENIVDIKRQLLTMENNKINNNYYVSKKEELKQLENIKNDGLIIDTTSYLEFILNDTIFYIQLGDNPFLDNYYSKKMIDEINNNKYVINYDYYLKDLSIEKLDEIITFDLYNYNISKKEIKNSAINLLNFLLSANYSEVVRTKKRVNNYYNNSYHYEYINEKRKREFVTIEEIKKNDRIK